MPEVLKDQQAATLMDGKELAKLVKDELKVNPAPLLQVISNWKPS